VCRRRSTWTLSAESDAESTPLNTFRVSRRRREMYSGHARLCVCVSLAAFPHYCTDPDVTLGMAGVPLYSCEVLALMGGFAIGVRVSLL